MLHCIIIVCHFLVYCPLRLWSSWGQKTTPLPVVSRRPRSAECSDVDDENNRCIFNLISNFQIHQILSIPSHMPILLLRVSIAGAFLNVSQVEEKGEKKQLLLMVTAHIFSINIKNNLHKTYKVSLSLLIISIIFQRDKRIHHRSQSSWKTEVGLTWLHLISHCLSRRRVGWCWSWVYRSGVSCSETSPVC